MEVESLCLRKFQLNGHGYTGYGTIAQRGRLSDIQLPNKDRRWLKFFEFEYEILSFCGVLMEPRVYS